VTLSQGPASIPSTRQLPGGSLPVLQIQALNQSNAPTTITSLKLTASGTGNDATGINSVSIYLDANQNGVVDAGDTQLVAGSYTSDNGTVTLIVNNVIPAFSTVDYLVVDNFSTTASGTFQTSVAANGDVSGTDGTYGLPVLVTGAPIVGSTLTIAAATPTATTTATNTITSTITSTPTVTKTATKAITPGATPTLGIYPNPPTGGTVNILPPPYNGISDVRIELFTVAFRKIQDITRKDIPSGVSVSINLTDRKGQSLARGIYYVVVTTNAGRSIGKLLLLQ
jgi:hypothetical protein